MVALVSAFALTAGAAAIDGKWVAEMKIPAGKKAGASEQTITTVLDLKSSGSTLTGSVTTKAGRRDREVQIQDGKIEGNSFSFVTVMPGKKGDQKLVWKGTVEGDTLKGTRGREDQKRGLPFTAKKQ